MLIFDIKDRKTEFKFIKGSDLWIVMEYCGGGSVSDIMRMRKKTLIEDEISTILRDTLLGLEYLHQRRKIHRDIKAGNILLNSEGHAKLGIPHLSYHSSNFAIYS